MPLRKKIHLPVSFLPPSLLSFLLRDNRNASYGLDVIIGAKPKSAFIYNPSVESAVHLLLLDVCRLLLTQFESCYLYAIKMGHLIASAPFSVSNHEWAPLPFP